eukprot:Gb_00426 [translate_table: standard]
MATLSDYSVVNGTLDPKIQTPVNNMDQHHHT